MNNKTENSQSKTVGLEKNTPAEADGESNETYCEICNIRLTSHSTYLEHVAGKKHKKKAGLMDVSGKTKKEATEHVDSGRMTSHENVSKHSSHETNIPSHISQQNTHNYSPNFQGRKQFSSSSSEEISEEINLHQSNEPEDIRMDSDSTFKGGTRKRNNSQSKSRKKGCSDVSCFDDTINQVLNFEHQSEESTETSCFQKSMLVSSAMSTILDSSSQFHHLLLQSPFTKNNAIEDLLASENETRVKAEPLDSYEEQPRSSELQNMGLPTAISSVDSLIDLFASGSIKVKQEYDDPLIDVIKSVDPSVLVKACENDPAMKQMSALIESNFLNQAYETNLIKIPYSRSDNTDKVSKHSSNSVLNAPNALSFQPKSLGDKNKAPADITERSADVNESLPESISPDNPVVGEPVYAGSCNPVEKPDLSQPECAGSRDPTQRPDLNQPDCAGSSNSTQRPDLNQTECVSSCNTIQGLDVIQPEWVDSCNLAQGPDVSQPECVRSHNQAQRPDVSQTERVGSCNSIQRPDISQPESAGSHNSNPVQRPIDSHAPVVSEGVSNLYQEQDINPETFSEPFPKETSEVIKTERLPECDEGVVYPQMEDLVKELKTLSSMETDVKKNLLLADEKIGYHQRILEEWRSKKLQYQTKEEELRIKRNNVIQLMQVVLGRKSESFPCSSETSSNSYAENTTDIATNSNPDNVPSQYNIPEDRKDITVNLTDSMHSDIDHHLFEETNGTNDDAPGSEPDVCILDPVVKDNDFPVIDLEAENLEQNSDSVNVSKHNMVTNIVASSKKKIFDVKSFSAHQTVVNYLKVYGGYLYTCCNDCTAKRFCLNDINEVVTYNHTDKNVSQLCVNRAGGRLDSAQNQVVLFTLCSGNNIVSTFAANDGKLLKTYHHINKITCICTGWNLCYIALAGGSVISLNLKEEQEIIKSQNGSLVRIATAHQGGIRVLVTLTISGVISIHHAITGLLIRCLKDVLKPPAHMSVYNDYAFFSSIDAISILNISTGQIERKIPLSNPVTGLVIDKDYIFTSTFRGAIQCYLIKEDRNVKPCDVANFKAVTCIDVSQNWVFIGNRNGEIAVVKFSAGQQNVFDRRNT
ncbi:uncharacterized protein LOC129224288 [Uloborus diversus]|uniref:uncharacterized protein LOC129224288 n=1 Tax=Uloborus diversus TaxID=327109 RepID=UPI00240947D9|nr:uncharacterized protein LOC129224288 [Uloborus diversus]